MLMTCTVAAGIMLFQRVCGYDSLPLIFSLGVPEITEMNVHMRIPVIDAVPCSVEFVHDLFDLARVISGIFLQKLIGQLIKRSHALLSSSKILQEHLTTKRNQ